MNFSTWLAGVTPDEKMVAIVFVGVVIGMIIGHMIQKARGC